MITKCGNCIWFELLSHAYEQGDTYFEQGDCCYDPEVIRKSIDSKTCHNHEQEEVTE